jgi:hypothetical protein
VRYTVRLDDGDVRAGIKNIRQKFPFAIRRALLRAGNSGRSVMVKAIAEDTGLPQKQIRDEIKVNVVGDSGVQLEVQGRRIPLIAFKARGPEPSRGKGRGVSYRLPGGRGRAETAFIATMRSGHRGVFKRVTKARLPVVELRGPSLAKVFEKFLPLGAARAQEALTTNLRSEIKFALSRR